MSISRAFRLIPAQSPCPPPADRQSSIARPVASPQSRPDYSLSRQPNALPTTVRRRLRRRPTATPVSNAHPITAPFCIARVTQSRVDPWRVPRRRMQRVRWCAVDDADVGRGGGGVRIPMGIPIKMPVRVRIGVLVRVPMRDRRCGAVRWRCVTERGEGVFDRWP
jgi:hypothetical protein